MSLQIRYAFITFLIAASVIAAAVVESWMDYWESYRRQQATAVDIAKVVEAHLTNTVKQADNMLRIVADMIVADNGATMMRSPSRWKLLHSFCEGLVGCRSIAVVDPAGHIVALSDTPAMPNIDATDRVYFREPQRTRKLFVGPAVIARVKDNPILFSIARPVYGPAGDLLAVISAGMDTNHVTDFYGLMGFGKRPTVTIFKGNGDIVARYPDMALHVGKNNSNGPLFTAELPKAPSGVYESTSVLDGKKRLAAYRSITELDLIVFAGIEHPAATEDWARRNARTNLIMGGVLLVILGTLYAGYRSFVRQADLQATNRALTQQASTDGLTGIANRRLFDMVLQREWMRHRRDGTPLSILMIDLDCFKAYNDNYGHQAGDDCLYQIAQSLKGAVHRDVDLVARYGGEEFVVVLNSDANGAYLVAERIRASIEKLGIAHGFSSVGPFISISVGIASTSGADAKNPEELLRKADQALYEAKANGRNVVHPTFDDRPMALT